MDGDGWRSTLCGSILKIVPLTDQESADNFNPPRSAKYVGRIGARQEEKQKQRKTKYTMTAGNIQYMTGLPQSILAGDKTNGQSVKIFGVGNIEGHSPAALVVTTSGAIETRSLTDLRVVDPNFLPLGNQAFSDWGQFAKGNFSQGGTSEQRK